MKKITILFMASLLAVSCSKYDDSEIWDKLKDHDYRIAYLEDICQKMNNNIINVQTIITALETSDYIVNTSPLADGNGHVFIFKSGKSVIVRNGTNGKDGTNGTDGKDGANGKDGVVPVISVKQDTDGIYYWTIDGEWLIVNNLKVRASATNGTDGKDGEDGKDGLNGTAGKDGVDGKDGITPKFKIEDSYWYISYDNEITWELLGKATGDNGLNGDDGDSMFKRVYVEDGYVCFELNDGENSLIRIPLMKNGVLEVFLEEEGTLSNVLTPEETRTTTSLTVKGRMNWADMQHIQIMQNLQKLDLREANCESITPHGYEHFLVNPYQDTLVNRTLEEIILPKFNESQRIDFSYCLALNKVTITCDKPTFASFEKIEDYTIDRDMKLCSNISVLEYAEGVVNSKGNSQYWSTASSLDVIIYPSTLLYISSSLTVCPPQVETKKNVYTSTIPCKKLICKAVTPPTLAPNSFGGSVYYDEINHGYAGGSMLWNIKVPDDAVLYVPKESIELYKVAPLWEAFTNIQAIENM